MTPMSHALYVLSGRKFGKNDLVAVFSLRLDETGTDGRSPITVVAGAVALPTQWDQLEDKWSGLLARSGVEAFHAAEFNDRCPPYNTWSSLKSQRFTASQNKIIARNTTFRTSIGIEHAVHKEIKARMKGIRGFTADSDYGLCFRALLFQTSQQLVKIDPSHRLAVMVEDGPWAKGAYALYQQIVAMQGKWKPAKHAHRLAGFMSVPKGERPSLEAADLIADQELVRLGKGANRNKRDTLSVLLTRDRLEWWYERMMKEKEERRAWGGRKFAAI